MRAVPAGNQTDGRTTAETQFGAGLFGRNGELRYLQGRDGPVALGARPMTRPLNRRRFLHLSAAALAGGALTARAATADPKAPRMPMIDTHQHLWDLSKFRLPWVKPGTPLGHSFLLSDYQRAAEGLDI